MTLWLHIGLPKTGSSALQVFFAKNDAALKKNHLLYPWPGPAKQGRATPGNAKWLAMHEGGFPHDSERGEQLVKWLKRGRGVLLSSEELAKADPATLIGLRDLTDDTRVLVYLRDQADMMVSRFNQLRGYGKFGPERTLEWYTADSPAAGAHFRFGEFLDGIAGIFGREKMSVLSYRQNKHRLPQSALEAMGVPEDGFEFEVGKVNKTPDIDTPDPEMLKAIRARYRAENERAVNDWFPGQSVEDVFGA
jgi:hypothetical protein